RIHGRLLAEIGLHQASSLQSSNNGRLFLHSFGSPGIKLLLRYYQHKQRVLAQDATVSAPGFIAIDPGIQTSLYSRSKLKDDGAVASLFPVLPRVGFLDDGNGWLRQSKRPQTCRPLTKRFGLSFILCHGFHAFASLLFFFEECTSPGLN